MLSSGLNYRSYLTWDVCRRHTRFKCAEELHILGRMDSPVVSEANAVPVDVKIPKNCKENRYYYRHREEVLARKKEQRMASPEYIAKQEEKEQKRKMKEIEREQKKIEKKAIKEKEKETKRLAKMNALLKEREEKKNNKIQIKMNALLSVPPGEI